MRAAAYVRVSTIGQAEEGHSLDAQVQDIQNFAEAKGWTIVEIYRDEGLSGRLNDRPGLIQLLRDAKAGLFQVVIVHKVDRFYRDLTGFLGAVKQLHDADVAFLSVRENIDFTSVWGKLALVILATIAEIFIDNLKEETTKGKYQRARKGLWNGSIPVGYCRGLCSACNDPNGPGYCANVGQNNIGDGVNLVQHPIDNIAVRLMFEWYATGEYSYADIAVKMNQHTHTLPSGEVIHFRTRGRGQTGAYPLRLYGRLGVRDVINNIFYTGIVIYKQQTMPGNHPAIISPDAFERVMEVRQVRGHNPQSKHGSRRAKPRIYPLTGILRCGACGGRMHGQIIVVGGTRHYVCDNRRVSKQPCTQSIVRSRRLEDQVAQLVMDVQPPADRRAKMLDWAFPNRQAAEIEQRQTSLDERFGRAVELYLSGAIDRQKYEEEEVAYRREAALLTTGKNRDILETVQILTDFSSLWEAADPFEKKRLLHRVFVSVHVRGKAIEAVQPNNDFYAFFEYWSCVIDEHEPLPVTPGGEFGDDGAQLGIDGLQSGLLA